MSKQVTVRPPEEVALTLAAQQISDMLMSGYKIKEIGEALQLTRREVCRHLVEVNRRVIENGLLKRDHLRAQVFTDYDNILAELEDAWEASKPTDDVQPDGMDDETWMAIQVARAGRKENYTAGDARYLQLALEVLKQKRGLLGLDMAKEASGPTGGFEVPEGEDYVVKLHERFVTIKKNMARALPDDKDEEKPKVVDAEFTAVDDTLAGAGGRADHATTGGHDDGNDTEGDDGIHAVAGDHKEANQRNPVAGDHEETEQRNPTDDRSPLPAPAAAGVAGGGAREPAAQAGGVDAGVPADQPG